MNLRIAIASVLAVGSCFLSGCVAPLSQAPKTIAVKEEILVRYKGVLSSRIQEAKIKPGIYPFTHHNFACFYYSKPGENVSYSPKREPHVFKEGGVGVYRETGDVFFWQWVTPHPEVIGLGIPIDQSKKVEGAVAIIPKEQMHLIEMK